MSKQHLTATTWTFSSPFVKFRVYLSWKLLMMSAW